MTHLVVASFARVAMKAGVKLMPIAFHFDKRLVCGIDVSKGGNRCLAAHLELNHPVESEDAIKLDPGNEVEGFHFPLYEIVEAIAQEP